MKELIGPKQIESLVHSPTVRTTSYGNFMNLVLKTVFNRHIRAQEKVTKIVLHTPVQFDTDHSGRIACVYVSNRDKLFFFYVFGEKLEHNLQGWKITGHSRPIEEGTRLPDFENDFFFLRFP